MAKTVTLRIDEQTYQAFLRRAAAENRALSNFIETAVKEHIRECDFADASEMAEILTNESLVKRLRLGSKDARKRKGRMVG